MCPYLVIVGQTQTLNEDNDFCVTVLEACDIATRQSRGAVLINVPTDGVSCEVECNFGIIVRYLNGQINYLDFTDTKHNVKNALNLTRHTICWHIHQHCTP